MQEVLGVAVFYFQDEKGRIEIVGETSGVFLHPANTFVAEYPGIRQQGVCTVQGVGSARDAS